MSREDYITQLCLDMVNQLAEVPKNFQERRLDLVDAQVQVIKDKLHLVEHEIYRGI